MTTTLTPTFLADPSTFPNVATFATKAADAAFLLHSRVSKALPAFRKAIETHRQLAADEGLTSKGRKERFAPTADQVAATVNGLQLEEARTIRTTLLPQEWENVLGALWPEEPGKIARLNREIDAVMRMHDDRLRDRILGREPDVLRCLACMPGIERRELRKRLGNLPQSIGTLDDLARAGARDVPAVAGKIKQLDQVEQTTTESWRLGAQITARWRSGQLDEGLLTTSAANAMRILRRDFDGEQS